MQVQSSIDIGLMQGFWLVFETTVSFSDIYIHDNWFDARIFGWCMIMLFLLWNFVFMKPSYDTYLAPQ